MSVTWTTEQVIQQAPDDSSAKSGRGLVNTRHWVSLGRKDNALWGECQGSGSKPYQVQIDLTEPAFKCSCPSRKFPCKHGIGLLLLYVEQTDKVVEADPPTWVTDWFGSRTEKAEKKEAKKNEEKSPEEQAKADAQAAKRTAAREKKVDQGLADLDLWLRDLVRQGFSTVNVRDFKFWDDVAARMMDAQVGSIGRRIRRVTEKALAVPEWQDRVMEEIGLLYLLVEGYKRSETLSADALPYVRAAVGFSVDKDDVLGDPDAVRVEDTWLVLGQSLEDDAVNKLQEKRVWLRGKNSGRFALFVSFIALSAQGKAFGTFPSTPPPGASFQATLTFFPGASALRAVQPEQFETTNTTVPPGNFEGANDLFSAYADALAVNPWLENYPAFLQQVTPVRLGDTWFLRDPAGNLIPLTPNWSRGWHLMAYSGGAPFPSFFGEWNGRTLLPLTTVTAEGRLVALA